LHFIPSPKAFCAQPVAPNPNALATAIAAGIKAGKNPPLCVEENLISQYLFFSFFLLI
jgi:hypothetical protein